MSPDLFLSAWFSFYKDMKTSGYVFYLTKVKLSDNHSVTLDRFRKLHLISGVS